MLDWKGMRSMKTYQVVGRPNEPWFTNYDRIDEEILFQQITEKLKSISTGFI